MFPYIVTFPAYIVPFILIGAIWLLLSLINFMCYAFTDRYLLSEFLDWLIRECLGIGGGRSNKNGGTNETVYVVYDGGFERRLKLYEAYKQDYDDPSLHYDRFIDDLGNYWRSYDKGETFRKETLKEKGRGY